LTSTLCEVRPPRLVRFFSLLDTTYGGPHGQFQRNGGVHLAATMCWLLSEPIMKRCLFICDFHFDLMILILLLLSLAYAKGKEVVEDAPIETALGAHTEEAVDAEVVKITKEKQSVSDGFDDIGVVRDGASNDVDEVERVEV
jgi:hypothetical protein